MKTIAKLLLMLTPALAFDAFSEDCMQAKWKRGKPFDYYAAETRQHTGTFNGGLLYLVESAHFTNEVRSLAKGNTGDQPLDLYFVVNSIPNHPAALDAYSRYEYYYRNFDSFNQVRTNQKPKYQAECLMHRAAKIYPQYAETYLVWGMHYARNKQHKEAVDKYRQALNIEDKRPDIHYNLGLALLNIGQVEEAKKHAQIAYSGGFPLSGLRNKLSELAKKKEQ